MVLHCVEYTSTAGAACYYLYKYIWYVRGVSLSEGVEFIERPPPKPQLQRLRTPRRHLPSPGSPFRCWWQMRLSPRRSKTSRHQ